MSAFPADFDVVPVVPVGRAACKAANLGRHIASDKGQRSRAGFLTVRRRSDAIPARSDTPPQLITPNCRRIQPAVRRNSSGTAIASAIS